MPENDPHRQQPAHAAGDPENVPGEAAPSKPNPATEAGALAEAFLEQLRRGDAGMADLAGAGGDVGLAAMPEPEPEPTKKKLKKVSAKILQQMERRIAELEAQATSAAAEAEKSYDARIRLQADFENYRRRAAKDKADAVQYANEELLREVLPALDNLERAIQAAGPQVDTNPITEGVKITFNQIMHTLTKFGVSSFSSLGELFDPQLHDAMTQIETTDFPPGHVASEYVKGYRYRERLLRPAMVAVAKGPSKTEPKLAAGSDRVALGGPPSQAGSDSKDGGGASGSGEDG